MKLNNTQETKMKINLRKANALQLAINEALKGLSFESTVSVNEFQDPDAMLSTALERFTANIVRREKLLDTLYHIRKSVSSVNDSLGIDNLLADVARQEKEIVFYSSFAKAAVVLPLKELNGKLEKIKNQPADRAYYAEKEVMSSIFSATNIEKFKQIVTAAKKQKQQIQDELLELNISTKITLSDEDVKTLTDENIL